MGIRGYDNEILWLHKCWGLLDDLSDNQLLKKDSIPWSLLIEAYKNFLFSCVSSASPSNFSPDVGSLKMFRGLIELHKENSDRTSN
jgi:hypothetical protein